MTNNINENFFLLELRRILFLASKWGRKESDYAFMGLLFLHIYVNGCRRRHGKFPSNVYPQELFIATAKAKL
jgi:hypothetical protein